MIYRIIGRGGSGKTSFLFEALKEAFDSGMECILLTPEQQSITAERELCTLLGSKYNLKVEILNFERLPDRVFRENGGIAVSRADSQTRSLYTAISCERAKKRLSSYEKAALDKDFTQKISATISNFENCGISSRRLAEIANHSDIVSTSFKEKLFDISEIYTEYEEILKDGYADSQGVQKMLLESLTEKNFFEGKAVFIDGYYNFTPSEYPIVEMILKGAKDTYITILYDENDKSGIFDVNRDTLALTEKAGKKVTDIYASTPRKRSSPLSHLEKNVFSESETVAKSNDGIYIISCKNPFEESECVSNEILRLVKNGYRYKDISIAVRDDGRYEGILDTALKRYDIPFYSASKDTLSSKEISSLILSILEIAQTDWSLNSVLKYINTTLSPLSDMESDLISIYAETWRISGKRWYAEDEWILNPSGYKTSFSKRDEEMLKTVNSGREKLLFALEPVIEDLKEKHLTVAKGVRAIYNHLIHINAHKALENRVESLLEKGEEDEASRLSAVWDNIMSILDTLYETAGEMKVTPRRLSDLIRLMMDEYKIGSLPPYHDSVEVGNASIMRPSNCKVMIVLGVNDGVFPAEPDTAGLFSDGEKEILKSMGIESEILPDEHLKNEFLLFYNLCAAPQDELILTYSNNSVSGKGERPSMLADMVLRIMGKSCKKQYLPKPVFSEGCGDTFSEEVSIFPIEPDVLRLSSSKIEQYLKCPFSYYCKYILSLKKHERAKLNAADSGTYFHKIIELFTKSLYETGKFKSKSDAEIKEFFDKAKNEYIDSIFRGNSEEREKFAFDKHEQVILPLLKSINDELAEGGFLPKEFEGYTKATYPITEKTTAKFSGIYDRIDVLEKDGKKYIRIVDYKTGNKDITETDVKEGFEMQMLTYLFSCCKKDEIPAGVLYLLCRRPESGKAPFLRNGLMLKNDDIAEAMKFLSDNKQFSKSDFCSEETFEELKNVVADNIKKVGKDIIDGKMNISPTNHGNKTPCDFCDSRLYCRKKLDKENKF